MITGTILVFFGGFLRYNYHLQQHLILAQRYFQRKAACCNSEEVSIKLYDIGILCERPLTGFSTYSGLCGCENILPLRSFRQLKNVHQHLEKYLEKFHSRLGAGNRRYIQTLMVLTRAFIQATLYDSAISEATETATHEGSSESSVEINDFLFTLNIDNINFVKLINYVKESNIIHKVSGYGDKLICLEKQKPDGSVSNDGGSTLSGFRALLDLLLALTNKNVDGRVIVSKRKSSDMGEQEAFIKYVMLTGEKTFSEIVNQAHAVVMVGGTLQPIEETRERLFPWLPLDHLHFFSCGHIVPPESILPIAVSRGPSGLSFDFSYTSRSLSKTIEELGLLLSNVMLSSKDLNFVGYTYKNFEIVNDYQLPGIGQELGSCLSWRLSCYLCSPGPLKHLGMHVIVLKFFARTWT